MAKLYFKFGTMGSSKTANALMTRFNYLEKGYNVWLIKPTIDNRDDTTDEQGNHITIIKSRIGLSAQANIIKSNDNIATLFSQNNENNVIICDECQFLTKEQVEQLKQIAVYFDVPVICFGLRSDFQSNLFEGSKRLFELADSISEIKSICKCGQKSIINARMSNGKVVTEGEQIDIGGNEKYEGMCYRCWIEKRMLSYFD